MAKTKKAVRKVIKKKTTKESTPVTPVPQKRKVQIIRRIREVYEFEVDEGTMNWEVRNKIESAINSDKVEEADKEFKLKLLERTTLDTNYPIGDKLKDVQTHKENLLIMDEFVRIWTEYPHESFSATLQELARTIHENADDDYDAYLPEDYWEKYYTNEGTEEDPDYVPIEELWSERWDAEYNAIHMWIKDMDNDTLLKWMKSLIEFIGY